MMGPDYMRLLYAEPPLQLQLLSLVDVRTDVHKHFQGFVSGELVPKSIFQGQPSNKLGRCSSERNTTNDPDFESHFDT